MASSSNKKYCCYCNPSSKHKFSYWKTHKEIKKMYSKTKPDKRSAFNKIKRTMIKPDCCTECNKETDRLAIHHIDKDINNNELDNLIYLCYECHRAKHPDLPDKFFE